MAERLIGMLIFPRLTQLDMTGPYEVLARLPNTKVHLVAHTMAPVKTDRGMEIVPTVTIADCPQLDLVMVPGGPGQQDLMEDAVVLDFLRKQAAGAKYVTSVCTGSLVLGAAGLLKGKRATCHWAAIEHLKPLGAIPVSQKVVMDGNIITGAGVTSGIDFALAVAAIAGRRGGGAPDPVADRIRSSPPFDSGSPATASAETLALVRSRWRRSTSSGARSPSASARKLGVPQ